MNKQEFQPIPNPHQICSAPGWRAVYKHLSDSSLFTVPLAYWGLVKDFDPIDLIPEPGNIAVIGFVVKESLMYPAPELEVVGDIKHSKEDPAIFCGYLGPGEELEDY